MEATYNLVPTADTEYKITASLLMHISYYQNMEQLGVMEKQEVALF